MPLANKALYMILYHNMERKPGILSLILFIFFSIINNNTVLGQDITNAPDTLFMSNEIISMELRTDFSQLQEKRQLEEEWEQEGELIYYNLSGDPVVFSIKVEPRGNFRLDPQNCDFPPLMVNFDKDKVGGTLFENQNKIKLVTPCQYEEDVLEEYLIYRMYNKVTDYSLAVRLVEILYYDTGRGKRVFKKYSFFIEDIDHLAERMNGVEIETRLDPFTVNRQVMKKMHVFQYLIGNKDWYITTGQNMKFIQSHDTTELPVTVPYDFDFSEFVNADYTKPRGVPDEMLEDRREYKGLCYSREEFQSLFRFYRSLKPEFIDMIMNMELISKFTRKQNVKYIERFYEVIDDEELFQKEFMSTCKTRKDYFLFEE